MYDLSVIVSVFNEEEALPKSYPVFRQVLESMSVKYQLIFVNDGSSDNSFAVLRKIAGEDPNVQVYSFSRNFGHEAAMLAGIDKSDAKAVICMDADLQHPPALIPQMYDCFLTGNHIVNMVREERKDGGFRKAISSKLFYKLVNSLSDVNIEPNASDFFLISGRVADLIKNNYREQSRFLRGLIQSVGFRKCTLSFVAPERIAGVSKYSFIKLLVFSFSAVSSLSKAPLRIGIFTGIAFAFIGVLITVYSIIMRFLEQPAPGYSTIIVALCLMFSVLFFILGIMGEYIGLLFDEAKKRPHYIIEEEIL